MERLKQIREARGIEGRLIALNIHDQVLIFQPQLQSRFGNPVRAGGMRFGRHDGFAAKTSNALKDPLIIGCDKSVCHVRRRHRAFIDMLNHGLAGDEG